MKIGLLYLVYFSSFLERKNKFKQLVNFYRREKYRDHSGKAKLTDFLKSTGWDYLRSLTENTLEMQISSLSKN